MLLDQANITQLQDINRGNNGPVIYRGDDVTVAVGLGINAALFSATIANYTSVTLQIFTEENDTNAPMVSVAVASASMNLTLTQANWAAGGDANCHALFAISGAVTASIDLLGNASRNCWLRIFATSADATGKTISFAEGPITINDGPVTLTTPPEVASFRFFTVGGQVVPQLLDTTTGLYHTLGIENDGGVLTLQISDTGY
jgi:hypothetical protein